MRTSSIIRIISFFVFSLFISGTSYSQCEITDISMALFPCVDSEFQVDFDFEYVDNVSSTFDLKIYDEGNTLIFEEEFPYAALPVTFFVPSSSATLLLAVVNDTQDPNCAAEEFLDNPCWEEECLLSNLTETTSDCQSNGGFTVTIDFDYSNMPSDMFTYEFFDDISGTYAYADLPLVLDLVDVPNWFWVTTWITDSADPTCSLGYEFPNPCYLEDCVIENITISNSDCQFNEWFVATIDFDYANVASDMFTYEISGNAPGTYPYADLPLSVDVVSIDGWDFLTLTIIDSEDPSCQTAYDLPNPCFGAEDCFFSSLTAEVLSCEDGIWAVSVDFEHENAGDFFDLHINYEQGIVVENISFTDLPYTVDGLVEECISDIDIVVYASNNEGCFEAIGIGPVCCPIDCALTDLSIDVGSCTDGTSVITIDFDYVGTTNEFFDLNIPGYITDFFPFSSLPLSLTIDNTTTVVFDVFINENDNPNCGLVGIFDNACYDSNGVACALDDLSAEVVTCEGDLFDVEVNFYHENTSDQFTIQGNGSNYGTFSYADLPITLTGLEANCETSYEFIVIDVNDEACSSAVGIGIVCCEIQECTLHTLDFGENPTCVDGSIITQWLIAGDNVSEVGFDIFINGEFQLFVEYNDSDWYDFDIMAPETEFFSITVCDNDNPNCCIEWELENPCYEGNTGNCLLDNLTAEVVGCEGDLFDVEVNFFHENTSDQFTLYGNGNDYGTYAYTDLPLVLNGLEANCETPYEFIVIDVNDEACSSAVGIGIVCCEIQECTLHTLDFGENPICVDGSIITQWLIAGDNVSEVGFDIFINGEFQLFVEYNDSDWYDFDIIAPETEFFSITVCDNDNPNCCIEWELENPCYEGNTGNCLLDNLSAEVVGCEGDLFDVEVNFFYENTSDQFTIYGNGNDYGTYTYTDLPLVLNGLEANCETPYEFIVIDVNDEACSSAVGIGIVCCEGQECNLHTLDFGENPTCVDGSIITQWLIAGDNVSEVGFDIFINGEFQLFVEYNDSDWYDFDIIAPETEFFSITVCDNDNPNCCIEWELENPCYEGNTGNCLLDNLTAEVVGCEGDLFDVEVNFFHENTSDQFAIYGNGNDYGIYAYTDLPLVLNGLEANCETPYEFVVIDVNDEACSSAVGIGIVCCENFNIIDEVVVTNIIVEDSISIILDVISSLLPGCEIDVYMDSELVGTLVEDDLSLALGYFACGTDEVVTVQLINTCTQEIYEFVIDISDIECVTATADLDISDHLTYDMHSQRLTLTSAGPEILDIDILAMDGALVSIHPSVQSGWSTTLSLPAGIYIVLATDRSTGARGYQKILCR